MHKTVSLITASIFLFASHSVHSGNTDANSTSTDQAPTVDPRQLVDMPEQTRKLMRDDMLDHLSALNEIIGYLAENNLEAVAETAETRMGKSSMGKHRGTSMGPGRFMPLEMRNIGWGMHESATELSQAAKNGDLKGANAALQKVTTACVACHYSYRTR